MSYLRTYGSVDLSSKAGNGLHGGAFGHLASGTHKKCGAMGGGRLSVAAIHRKGSDSSIFLRQYPISPKEKEVQKYKRLCAIVPRGTIPYHTIAYHHMGDVLSQQCCCPVSPCVEACVFPPDSLGTNVGRPMAPL